MRELQDHIDESAPESGVSLVWDDIHALHVT
ncbi:MAG: hypothetical protein QOI21_1664 [Actinomycetota bacterium]|jgi:hypothetical protein|nr:hypothetical protein [Actinomycetota bacterium]